MAVTSDMVKDLRGAQLLDARDEKVGTIGEVYVDNATGEPKWVTVSTGLLGSESFVPLDGAHRDDAGVHVTADKKTIKNSPEGPGDDGALSESAEHRLYSHYGLSTGASGGGRNTDGRTGEGRDAARDRGDDSRDQDGRARDEFTQGGMTRSEERLSVGTESHETGRVRLRKYVVTENQSVDVPVTHEEVRLERESLDGRPARGTIGEDEQSVTLHAERPVVSKEAYEVEKVRLDTRSVTEHETVSDEVRKEQVDVEDPDGVLSRRDRK